MSNHSIGSFLAVLRKASGMTQKQLAEKLNVSDKAVSRWERDECAPDLSLIPVLAEIFDVTCDEILRGQRANPDALPRPQAEEKAKKRLRHLLNQTKTNYRIRSLISCLLAAAALIAAMICNLGFQRAHLGFLCGALLFIAAAVCQAIFTIQTRAALDSEDFDPAAVDETGNAIFRLGAWVYSLIFILFAATLPLMLVENAYWGLSGESWLQTGLLSGGAAVLLCFLICRTLSIRKGLRKPIDWKAPVCRLRLKMICIFLSAILLTGVLQFGAEAILRDNAHLYSDSTRFDDWDSFKALMEQPTSPHGEVLTYKTIEYDADRRVVTIYTDNAGRDYGYYILEEGYRETVTAGDGTVLCQYDRLNHNVFHITYSNTDDRLPVYVHSQAQYADASRILSIFMAAWIPLYLAEAAAVIIVYRRKAKAFRQA